MTILDELPVRDQPSGDAEALIKEARRRQRKRWAIAGVAVLAVALTAALVYGSVGDGHRGPATGKVGPGGGSPDNQPSGVAVITPQAPGVLAVGPNGNLYVADDTLNEILEWVPGGRFVVVAGNGHAGFSGDGARATRAEINWPEQMAFGRGGTLYFADSRNDRVRAVLPDGVITTVVGNGKDSSVPPRSGTPALGASLGGTSGVAISASGSLFLTADDSIFKVIGSKLISVATDLSSHSPQYPFAQCSPAGLAFDRSGDLYVNCSNIFDVIMRRPDGGFVYRGLLRPHDVWVGIAPGHGDTVLGVWQDALVMFTPARRSILRGFCGISGVGPFWLTGVAAGASDTIYMDQEGDAGVGPPSIVAMSPKGTFRVLWSSVKHPRVPTCQ